MDPGRPAHHQGHRPADHQGSARPLHPDHQGQPADSPAPPPQALLRGPDTDWVATTATEDDRGHGRIERRTIRVAPADDSLFPGARQAFRLRRDTGGLDGVWTSKEIVYGITSLPADLAGPAQLNHYERRALGRGKSSALGPRRHLPRRPSQLRTGTAPRALAAFRNLAISTLRLAGRANIAHARRDLHDHNDAFAVYGI